MTEDFLACVVCEDVVGMSDWMAEARVVGDWLLSTVWVEDGLEIAEVLKDCLDSALLVESMPDAVALFGCWLRDAVVTRSCLDCSGLDGNGPADTIDENFVKFKSSLLWEMRDVFDKSLAVVVVSF